MNFYEKERPSSLANKIDEEFADLDGKERSSYARGEVAEIHGLPIDRLPESAADGELAEEILVNELGKLSLAEHERVMFDLCGVPHSGHEDPPDLEIKLSQLEDALGRIKRKKAYDLAKYYNNEYVTDRAFRLMFLRSDRFDPKVSAQRLARHFQVKADLFGNGEVLGRDIKLSDLSKEDRKALDSGSFQILPSRDTLGRGVYAFASMHRPLGSTVLNGARSMWYIFNTTLKDEETQRKGMVVVVSNAGKKAQRERLADFKQLHYMRSGIPMKVAGLHYCYDDILLKPFVVGVQLFLDKEARNRFRSHFGDAERTTLRLQTFSIPTESLPFTPNREPNVAWHQEWLRARQIEEEKEGLSTSCIIVPRRFDVLFGRGRKTREHTGNLRAGHLVEMFRGEYEKAGKLEKTRTAEKIVSIIEESHGRFLKWEDCGWVEVDRETSREKVSHWFRHLRSKNNSTATPLHPTLQATKRVTPCPSPAPTLEQEALTTKQARVEY